MSFKCKSDILNKKPCRISPKYRCSTKTLVTLVTFLMLNHHCHVYTHKFEFLPRSCMGHLWSNVTLKWTPIFELHMVSLVCSLNEILHTSESLNKRERERCFLVTPCPGRSFWLLFEWFFLSDLGVVNGFFLVVFDYLHMMMWQAWGALPPLWAGLSSSSSNSLLALVSCLFNLQWKRVANIQWVCICEYNNILILVMDAYLI